MVSYIYIVCFFVFFCIFSVHHEHFATLVPPVKGPTQVSDETRSGEPGDSYSFISTYMGFNHWPYPGKPVVSGEWMVNNG